MRCSNSACSATRSNAFLELSYAPTLLVSTVHHKNKPLNIACIEDIVVRATTWAITRERARLGILTTTDRHDAIIA
jgi:hypothetical protein